MHVDARLNASRGAFATCQKLLSLLLLCVLAAGPLGCNIKKGSLQGSFLGSGFYRPRSAGVLSVVWRRHIDPNYRFKVLTWKLNPEERAVPVIDEENQQICIGSERQFFSCFSQKNGKRKWYKKLTGRIIAKAALGGEAIYVGTTSGLLYALNRSDGKLAWDKPYQADGEILSPPVFIKPDKGDPLVVFTASNNKVLALEAETGKFKWLYKRDPPSQLSIRGQAPPLYKEGVVYTGFSDGTVSAIDAQTGVEKWNRSIKDNDRFPDVDAALAFEEDVVYAASYSGSLCAIDAKTGKVKWKRKMPGAGAPVVSDGHVFAATSDGRVFKLSAENGKMLWKKPLKFKKAGAFGDLIVDDYHVYIPSSKYGMYVLHRDKGRVIQILRFGGGFAQPIRKESTMYVLSHSSFLYALSTKRNTYVQR